MNDPRTKPTFPAALLPLLMFCSGVAASEDVGSYAGRYHRGWPLGFEWTMDVDASGAFHYRWAGCMGLYDENRGRLLLDGAVLRVETERPVSKDSPFSIPRVWLPIRWGDRLYLLAKDEQLKLVNEVNEGSEPRRSWSGNLLLRAEDWNKEVSDHPELPESFLRLLLKRPIIGTVMSATRRNAQIDLGSRHGVFVGMELHVRSSSNDPCILTVTKAWASQSMARAECISGRLRAGAAVSPRGPYSESR